MIAEARRAAVRERNENAERRLSCESDPEESGWSLLEQAAGIDGDAQNAKGGGGEEKVEKDLHADTAMKLLLSKMPKGPSCLIDGVLLKLNHDFSWLPFRVVVSPDHVLFAKPKANFVLDSVPLLDVVHIEDVVSDANIPGFVDHKQTDNTFHDGKLHNAGAAWRNIRNHASQSSRFSTTTPCFELRTCDGGYNGGRSYYLKADPSSTTHSNEQWTETIRRSMSAAVLRKLREQGWLKRQQARALKFYQTDAIQGLVAALILGNFITNIAQTEMQPAEGSVAQQRFTMFDNCFTGIFTVELALNIFGNWFWPFVSNAWSLFDFLVVSVSLMSLIFASVPGFSVLRLMRAFRVLRLFGRLSAFRKILKSITIAIFPVSNAFVILFMVSAIYSIMGVTFFGQASPELFGNFASSFFTMFQVVTMQPRYILCSVVRSKASTFGPLVALLRNQACTGEGWASTIARPLFLYFQPDGAVDPVTAIFFSSYVIIVGWTLLSVVVAVLLDNFIQASWSEREAEEREKRKKKFGKSVAVGPLDPLLLKMSHFRSSEDLQRQIELIFRAIDVEETGALSYTSVRDGLRKLCFDCPLMISADDYQFLTNNGELCNDRGEMTFACFEKMMLLQSVEPYVYEPSMRLFRGIRWPCNGVMMESLTEAGCGKQLGAIIFSIKMMVGIVDDILEKDPQLQEMKRTAQQFENTVKGSLQKGISSLAAAAARQESNMKISQSILARLRSEDPSTVANSNGIKRDV